MLEISLAAEKIGHIGPMPITNSLLTTWVVMAILVIIALLVKKNISLVPSHGQSIMELILEALYDFFESVVGHHIKKIFPLIASLFLFIILGNWIGMFPGVGTIGFFEKHEVAEATEATQEEKTAPVAAVAEDHTGTSAIPATKEISSVGDHEAAPVEEQGETETKTETKFVPLLRGATADLNMTIALAIIALISMQYFGFQTLGFHYSKRFFNFSNPIMFFVGLLELVSDFSKIISFAFRLFGNVFAGEVLLAVMAFLMPFIAPMPFMLLELFVGFIQALVFSTLTAVFINVAVSHEE